MVKSTVKHSKCSLRLIVRNFVSGFVDTEEAEVAVLTYFAVFSAVDGERFVAGCGEFFAVGVV
jgi:hypothetical protein